MIRIQDLTPEIYYKQSRDFQFLGRLIDIIMNSVKTNTDLIYNLSNLDLLDAQIIDLMASTLGFQSKHKYSTVQLVSILSVFSEILRNKGNIKAIELAGKALLNSEGLSDQFGYNISDENPYNIQLFIPPTLTDITLFTDLLEYIMPAGMTYDIVRAKYVEMTPATTSIGVKDNITISAYVNADTIAKNNLTSNSSITTMTQGTIYNAAVVGTAEYTTNNNKKIVRYKNQKKQQGDN